MWLIVGLGNPGRIYANNRHNVGFICLNHYIKSQGIRFDTKQGRARIGAGEIAGSRLVVAEPRTYMNSSGESVSRLTRQFSINLNNLVVIHDDLDLPLGRIRIRHGGSSGGHKGIDSIVECLGSQEFIRIRVGIGRPAGDATKISEEDIIAYVLGDFTLDEKQIISPVTSRVSEALLCLITEGLASTMNSYN